MIMRDKPSALLPALRPRAMLDCMKPALSAWLGETHIDDWLAATDVLPICSALFLEVHPASGEPRCDLVTSVVASDGSLSAFLRHPPVGNSPIWRKTLATLRKWAQQLDAQDGRLRSDCFMIWLEFDLCARQNHIASPGIFLALTPRSDLRGLAAELGDYPDLQRAVLNFQDIILKETPLLQDLMHSNALALGHIGYMGSRQDGDHLMPLRSCWRCDDLPHVQELLKLAGIYFDATRLQKELRWVDGIVQYVNSVMLDLDTDTGHSPDFSVELNVFRPTDPLLRTRESAILQAIVERGLMSITEKQKLTAWSGQYISASGQGFDCSLHHIKMKFSDSRIQQIKCYWLNRV